MKLKTSSLHVALIALAAAPSVAFAVLGDDLASIQTDSMQLNANERIAKQAAYYTVHELITPDGAAIREYATVNGKVFAVAWNGPAVPDLRQLMGIYFDSYADAAATLRAGNGQVAIRREGLVVRSGRHMRAFAGSAYVANMLPPGVAESDIN